MSRFSNRPCAQCATDTFHDGLICQTCGAIFQMPNREALRSAKVKDFMRRKYSPRRREEHKAQVAARKAGNIRPMFDTPTARGPFGSGRERTKA